MRLRYVLALALATGCAPHFKREVIGHGAVALGGTGAGGTLQLARGTYELALHFDVPRAQVVDYVVTCHAQTRTGRVGETFDAYRTRRLAELRTQAEHDHALVSGVTGALVGSVAPDVHAHAESTSPTTTTTADATVSGQAVGAAAGTAVADAAVAPPTAELPPGDVGAGRLQARVDFTLDADTACTLAATAEDATVAAGYDVTRIHDLDAEARERNIAATAGAHTVRGQLTAQLALDGADPDGLRKRREADAQVRAAADAERIRIHAEAQAKLDAQREARDRDRADADAERIRIHAEAQAKLDAQREARDRDRADADAERIRIHAEAKAKLEADANLRAQATVELGQRREHAALETRAYLIAYLAGECHADAHKRERERVAAAASAAAAAAAAEQRRQTIQLDIDAPATLEANVRAERDARDAKARAERDARDAKARAERDARDAKLRAERDALEALRAHRIQVAFGVRAELAAYLVTIGAHERPPMPEPIAEVPGPAPFDGAQWISGHWQWSGAQWAWTSGGWHDSMTFGAAGDAGGAVMSASGVAGAVMSASGVGGADMSANVGGGAVISTGTAVTAAAVEPAPVTDPSITVQADYPIGAIRTESSSTAPVIRDHRASSTNTSTSTTTSTTKSPVIRDHRTH